MSGVVNTFVWYIFDKKEVEILLHLAELRKKTGKTQAITAHLMGLQTTVYQRWEQGIAEPSWEMAIRIAEYFNVSLDYLAGFTDEPRKLR